MAGYKLKNTLSTLVDQSNQSIIVNRGLVTESNSMLVSIVEQLGMSPKYIAQHFTGDELVSMNLFGLQPDVFEFARKERDLFIEKYSDELEKELLLPETISRFLEHTGASMQVLHASDSWVGLTYPDDVAVVRKKLKHTHV